jgi:hypothetical protein
MTTDSERQPARTRMVQSAGLLVRERGVPVGLREIVTHSDGPRRIPSAVVSRRQSAACQRPDQQQRKKRWLRGGEDSISWSGHVRRYLIITRGGSYCRERARTSLRGASDQSSTPVLRQRRTTPTRAVRLVHAAPERRVAVIGPLRGVVDGSCRRMRQGTR